MSGLEQAVIMFISITFIYNQSLFLWYMSFIVPSFFSDWLSGKQIIVLSSRIFIVSARSVRQKIGTMSICSIDRAVIVSWKIISQSLILSLLNKQSLLYSTYIDPISLFVYFISATIIDAKMPCWSCHLCQEWNQPTYESCIECCHRKCHFCKVHYEMMSYRTQKASRSRIPVRSARSSSSAQEVTFSSQPRSGAKAKHSTRTLIPSKPSNKWAHPRSHATRVFPSASNPPTRMCLANKPTH